MTEKTKWPQTDRSILDALFNAAREHTMTFDELIEQRVSWVYGMLAHDGPRTKEEVREQMRKRGLIP